MNAPKKPPPWLNVECMKLEIAYMYIFGIDCSKPILKLGKIK